jgi:hypothetical protein
MARGDVAWAAGKARRLPVYGVMIACGCAVGMIVLGPWGFRIWPGSEFANVSRMELAGFSAFFAAHVWRHVHHMLMIGTGQLPRLARIQLAETAVVAVVAWFALRAGGLAGMLFCTGLTIAAITGTLLPRQIGRKFALAAPVGKSAEPLGRT